MKLWVFTLLTVCGFLVFALTMTFVPFLPIWSNHIARGGFLIIFGVLWWVARDGGPMSRFRPGFFADFTAIFALSLGFLFANRGLKLFDLTTQTAKRNRRSEVSAGIADRDWDSRRVEVQESRHRQARVVGSLDTTLCGSNGFME